MFNGTDLSGWEGAGSGAAERWDVRDGPLRCTGKRGPGLRSAEEHGDFNLRNTLEIDCNQTVYRVVDNGTEIINAAPEQAPELGRRCVAGHLGLQNHNEEVYFRRLRIGPGMALQQLPPTHRPPRPTRRTKPPLSHSRRGALGNSAGGHHHPVSIDPGAGYIGGDVTQQVV